MASSDLTDKSCSEINHTKPRRRSEEGNGYSMFKSHKASGDSRARLPRRHKLAIGASAAGAAIVAFAMAAPAGALGVPTNVNYPAASRDNPIVGSGSSTDYQMMIGMDSLFNRGAGLTSSPRVRLRAPPSSAQPGTQLRLCDELGRHDARAGPRRGVAGQPVQRRGGFGASHRLVQRHRPARERPERRIGTSSHDRPRTSRPSTTPGHRVTRAAATTCRA